jgi:mannose-1-phosphate guanylyltransferase
MDDMVYLLGADPDKADTELGYIVPVDRKYHKPTRVLSFVERPDSVRARTLIRAGALWNMFVIAGSVRALLDLYEPVHGESVALMRAAINRKRPLAVDNASLAGIYRQLPTVDFSRDLLEPQSTSLQVLGVPPCGWNDLGTPKRVVETLLQLPAESVRSGAPLLPSAALSLADQFGRLSRDKSSYMLT